VYTQAVNKPSGVPFAPATFWAYYRQLCASQKLTLPLGSCEGDGEA
jgi:hypothetical protein